MYQRIFIFAAVIILLAVFSLPADVPHPELLQKIKNGEIKTPFYLEHLAQLRERGINAPSALPDGAKPYMPQSPPRANFNAIVILVDFSDNISQVTANQFDNLIFGTGSGTVRDYYDEVSYGNLTIVTINLPGSLGWLRAPQTYSYYVNGQNGFGSYPQNAQKLAEDAVALADPLVDFSVYDNNGDGYVDALFIIHAGPGAEFTGSNNDIWSHKWNMISPQSVDGVLAYTYSMEPEYWQTPGDMTCGVFVHEMGHSVFGLPDLYDRDYSSNGLGRWSLMAGGSWNGYLGNSPAHPDAWCRVQMGYVTPTNIQTDTSGVIIPEIENNPTIFRLWTNGTTGTSQYFLVENRQQTGYDSALPSEGLLIYHIDESVSSQNDNEWYPGYTSYGHYLVALEQADGLWELEKDINSGNSGDPFPGSTNKRTFDLSTVPSSQDYNFNPTNVAVRNISNSLANMTADFEVTGSSSWTGDFLIWEPDPTPLSGPVIQTLLQNMGYTADYTTNILIVPDLSGYQAIFVCLGVWSNNHVLQETEAQPLVAYLNGGGKIYMEGADTWAYDSPTSLHSYFNIQGIADGTGDLAPITGITGTFTDSMSFSYNGENKYIDRLGPAGSAFPILQNPSIPYYCAIAYDASSYRTIGTSFEFGGLNDATLPSTKEELLSRILNFFSGGGSPAKPVPENVVAGTGFNSVVPITWDPPQNVIPSPWQIKSDKYLFSDKLLAGRKINGFNPRALTDTVTAYQIYRSNSATGPFTPLTTVDPHGRPYSNNEDYIDQSVVNNITYYYTLTALYSDGSESVFSDTMNATPSANSLVEISQSASTLPTIDGSIFSTEWNDATVINIAAPGVPNPISLYLKNDHKFLYIAVEDPNNISDADLNYLRIFFDDNNDGNWDLASPSGEGYIQIQYQNGNAEILFQPIHGNYPDGLVFESPVIHPVGVLAAVSLANGHIQYEAQINLSTSVINGQPGDTLGLWISNYDASMIPPTYYQNSGVWPYGSVWTAPLSYGKVILSPGIVQPDFIGILTVSDACTNFLNLVFGTAPDASDDYDPAYDLYAPPPPPSGAFDARFRNSVDDFFRDFRRTNSDSTIIWEVHFQPSAGCDPITLSWDSTDLPPDGEFHLTDILGTDIDMRVNSSYTILYPAITQMNIVYSFASTFDQTIAPGWNLMGLPLDTPDKYYLSVYPDALTGTLFGWNGSYFNEDTMKMGKGYWLRFATADVVQVEGSPLSSLDIDMISDWNIISGGVGCNVPLTDVSDPGNIIVSGTLFGFNGTYFVADTIKQGEGYWLRTTGPGQITFGCGTKRNQRLAKLQQNLVDLTAFPALHISDPFGSQQILYFNVKLPEEVNKLSYSLPPLPPAGAFDVRFAGDMRITENDQATIFLQSTNYPITITGLNIPESSEYQYVLIEIIGGEEINSHPIGRGISVKITNPQVKTLYLSRQQIIPLKFSVEQNYPNPFNPSTTIRYAIPEDEKVEISVYNPLGQKIRTIIDRFQDAGYYSVEWNGRNDQGQNVGSGIYFLIVKAGEHSSIRKMILLK